MQIKAIIKQDKRTGGKVLYFKSGSRFFKMMSKNDIQILSHNHITTLVQNWNTSTVEVVHLDEQVLYKGKPVHVTNHTIYLPKSVQSALGLSQEV